MARGALYFTYTRKPKCVSRPGSDHLTQYYRIPIFMAEITETAAQPGYRFWIVSGQEAVSSRQLKKTDKGRMQGEQNK